MNSRHLTGWLFTAALFTALLFPLLTRDGMFFDGTIYASISRNMAEGTGSFWSPYYTATLDPDFYESPPLGLGLQSIFFRIFGDHFWVERLYCLIMALIAAALIISIWKRVPDTSKATGWVPLMLWLAIPLVHWSYTNNMLENTMTVFCLLAIILLFNHVEKGFHYLWQLVAAAMIFCAFMTKGFTGLFPLAFYFLHWLIFRQYSFTTMIGQSMWLLLYIWIIAAPFFFMDSSSHALGTYLKEQVINSIQGNREVDGHFFILKKLSMELVAVAGITAVSFILLRALKQQANSRIRKYSLFFLLLALAGSLPVMISPKQSGFYVLATLPFFAMAAAAFIHPLFTGAVKLWPLAVKIFSMLFITVIAGVLTWSALHFGEPRRNGDMLHDIAQVKKTINSNIIKLSPSLEYDYTLHANLMRYAHISAKANADSDWYLSDGKQEAPAGYEKVGLPLKVYQLYKASH